MFVKHFTKEKTGLETYDIFIVEIIEEIRNISNMQMNIFVKRYIDIHIFIYVKT